MSHIKNDPRLFAVAALLLIAAVGCSPGANPSATPGAEPTATPLEVQPTATPFEVSPIATPVEAQPTATAFDVSPIATPLKPGGATVSGIAAVDSVDLLILESFPVQIQATVKGYLADGCTTLDQVAQARQGNTFKITLTTTRPADRMCTQALVPFEQTIALDVYGLPAGTYTVDVNGVIKTFTLDIDNALPTGTP